MTALSRKLLRDLVQLRGQAATIAIVVACGIATYVALFGVYRTLLASRDQHYADSRFGDAFVHCKRAPDSIVPTLAAVPGVAVADAREVETIMLPMPDMTEPATAVVISLPPSGRPALDEPVVRRGRLPIAGHPDEVLLLESFADAHHVEPGGEIPAILNGVKRTLRVVGVALSPEYVYPVGALSYDSMADNTRFGVLWMDRAAMAPVFRMEGAFNDVVFRLAPDAQEAQVLDDVGRLLAPYGTTGAYPRSRQISNMIVDQELQQLSTMATMIPTVFLAIAAFLLNVVLSRMVHLQRAQIATLKAIGYRDREVGFFYVKLVVVVAVLGAALGIGAGALLGRGMLNLYRPYFRFPSFEYRIDAGVLGTAVAVTIGAALVGALATVRRIASLPPAEAMRPEAPATYHATLVERIGLRRLVGPVGMMTVRELSRRPLRTLLSAAGIAMAIAIMVLARFSSDAIYSLIDLEFETARRDDLTVSFIHPVPGRAERELAHVPGVLMTESSRLVPVRARCATVSRDIALIGQRPDARLRRVIEWPPRVVPMPDHGMIITAELGRVLGIAVGDRVELEILEGDHDKVDVTVVGFSHELFGLQAYMDLDSLREVLHETDAISSVAMLVDPERIDDVQTRLKDMPAVIGIARRKDLIRRFEKQSAEQTVFTTLILSVFGAAIAIAIVYNNARVALSTRERDLASLRVLGFTRAEISRILLNEIAAQVGLAILPGLALGRLLSWSITQMTSPEMFRLPVIVSNQTYVYAVMTTVAAAIVSALIVRRKLDRLDLVAVLKSRE